MEHIKMGSAATKITNDDDTFHFIGLQGASAIIILVLICLLAFALFLFLLHKFVQGPSYTKKNRIDNKVVIVTGCNSGIGKETVLELARRGAKIYMACRNWERCEAARLEIIEKTKNEKIYNRTLDLNSLASVRRFAAEFLSEEARLDILINNAGLIITPRQLSADGYEQTFAVNHLGHFLLTLLLLDRLKESAPSRIVVVSSLMYFCGRIKKDDLMGERRYHKFFGAYSQSKLANILFTRKLAEKLSDTGVTVNCLHPGVVRTNIIHYDIFPRWFCDIFWFTRFLLLKTVNAGAQTTLRLALDPALEKSSGGFYLDCMRVPLMWWARDKEMTDWLWEESEKLVGLKKSPELEISVVKDK